jgi:hypothetical protein
MVEQNDSFSREIDEELRREQLARLWERYGVLVIAVVVAIVGGIGGWKWYQYHRQTTAEALGARFERVNTLTTAGKTDEAKLELETIAKSGSGGYAQLAGLGLAGQLAKAGKRDEAVAAYDAIVARGGDRVLTDFARLEAAVLKSGTSDWTEMQNRLTPLMVDDGAWRHVARELLGTVALHKGMLDEARKAFEHVLTDRNVPEGVTRRVQDMMAMLAAKQVQSTAAGSKSGASPATAAGKDGAAATPAKK